MQRESSFFKQKLVWIGIVVILVVMMVFGLAMIGVAVSAQPKALPVALVVLDQPVTKPDGEKLAAGEMVKEKMLGQSGTPVEWKVLGSEAEALAGLDRQDYYGALVLPADLSAGLLSLQSPTPKPSTIQLYINEGKNAQVAATVRQMMQAAMQNLSAQLSKQLIAQVGQKMPQIPAQAVGALLDPFMVSTQTVHPVGANNANGSAPVLLTQIIWIGSLVTTIVLFLSSQQALKEGASRSKVVPAQVVTGLVFVVGASAFLLWMATAWYGMEIADWAQTWLFLLLSGAAFFLLQTTLLNWLGMPAIALIVLLLFFSMPVISMAPEMLPQAAKDWLYGWTPLRFVTEGLRSVMYYGGSEMGGIYQVLGWLGGICLLLASASAFKPGKAAAPVKSAA